LALSLADVGELDDAEAQLGEALNTLGRVDRPRLAAQVSVLLADVLMRRGAIDEADAALAKACRAFAALTDLSGLADALRQRGEIQMVQGTYTRSLAFANESARQAQRADAVPLQVRAMLLEARSCAALGDSSGAHEALERSFQLVAPGVATTERGDCVVTLADLVEAQILTSDRDVGSLLEEARGVYQSVGNEVKSRGLARRLRALSKYSMALEAAS
jgi:ATP/maltotriose-dependent transcriptional regulator MalT